MSPATPSPRTALLSPRGGRMIAETRTRALSLRRVAGLLEPGVVQIVQEYGARRRVDGLDVSGPFWTVGLCRVLRGRVRFRSAEGRVDVPWRTFGILLPPGAVVHAELDRAHAFSVAVLSRGEYPRGLPTTAAVFRARRFGGLRSLADALRLVPRRGLIPIHYDRRPAGVAQRLREGIDRAYAAPARLADIMRRCRLSPAVAARYFRKAYGLTPGRYRSALRVQDGMIRLASGQRIADIFQDVGFEDLSAFYRGFRALACGPPGRYSSKKSKNA